MRPEEIAYVIGNGAHGGTAQERLVGGIDGRKEGAVGSAEHASSRLENLVQLLRVGDRESG